MAEHYDVIIIGTGAGGGTLAHTLAPSGKKILMLERGAFEGMSLVAALIEDLARWPVAARRALVAVMRAKGASSEMRYAHQLDGHRRLRRSLEALTSG